VTQRDFKVDLSDLKRTQAVVNPLVRKLALWRREFSIKKAKEMVKQKYGANITCAVLCSGGCLDTLAAMRAGFQPVWGSEIRTEQAAMFEDLTGGKSIGDTFGDSASAAAWVHYWKSGQPCIDYALSGKVQGKDGETGWMFTKQVEVILHHMPWAFCLEISGNAPFVNKGEEVQLVRRQLSEVYVVYGRTVKLWQYGDPSNRKRLFMVGFLRELGQVALEFEWPAVEFLEDESVPTARCIAVPDALVEERYWRRTEVAADQILEHSADAWRSAIFFRRGEIFTPSIF
jgi:site-specific DNA-cytosine methylase